MGVGAEASSVQLKLTDLNIHRTVMVPVEFAADVITASDMETLHQRLFVLITPQLTAGASGVALLSERFGPSYPTKKEGNQTPAAGSPYNPDSSSQQPPRRLRQCEHHTQ